MRKKEKDVVNVELYVFCYRQHAPHAKGKMQFVYIDKEEFDELGSEAVRDSYSAPLGSSKRSCDIVGGIYEGRIKTEDDGAQYALKTGTWKYSGYIDDEELRAEWRAQDLAAQSDLAVHRKVKEDRSNDPMYEALKPIQRAMRKTNATGRRAIMASVLEYITR